MKSFILAVLIFVCFCGGAAAQASVTALDLDDAYVRWKKIMDSTLEGEAVQFCLASKTKKLKENKVSMEFIAFGDMSSFSVKLTPLNVIRDKDLKIVNEAPAGERATARQSGPGPSARSELTVLLPVGSNANSIRIEWDFVSNGEKFSQSHVISMENEPGIDFLGVTTPLR